jgi:ribonuclease PH
MPHDIAATCRTIGSNFICPFLKRALAASLRATQPPQIDLNYKEDSSAATDANFVMGEKDELIEIQCSAEKTDAEYKEFELMYDATFCV